MKFCVKLGIIWAVGLVIIIFGIIMGIFWSTIYEIILDTNLSLTNTSTNFKIWEKTPIPMYFKFYMFNWTNPESFTGNNSQKPNFNEMGPYVFREEDSKVNLYWNDSGTITFQRQRFWYFEPSLSNGTLEDKITNLNPISASIAYSLRFKNAFFRRIVSTLMGKLGQGLTDTKTVRELLYEGYNNTMLTIARKLNLTNIPFDKFGWFYDRNGTASYDGTFTMNTGVPDLSNLGLIKEWNYSNSSNYYQGECGKIRGTNGDLGPPMEDNNTVDVFVSDICTNLRLTYSNSSIVEGLLGSKYIADDTLLDNGTKVPSRSCYCWQGRDECVPTGMLNVSSCKFNAPAFVSLPHFYLADPSYGEAVDGMKPNQKKHEMAFILEPYTGVPLDIQAKLQLNMMIQNDPYISIFKGVKKTFIPMLWFTQEVHLTSEYASQVKLLLVLRNFGVVTFFGIAAIGCLLFFIGVFIWVRQKWRGEENQVLLSRHDNGDITNVN